MYEVDFLQAGEGNGDAICIRYGDEQRGYYLHVVDGGFSETSDKVIAHVEQYYGRGYHINHMVLTHADNDHASGLIGILEHFDVADAIWMNRPWRFAHEVVHHFHGGYTVEGLARKMREMHPYLIQIEEIATRKGIKINDVFQGATIGPFRVLAPSRERYIYLIPDLGKTPQSHRESVGALGAASDFVGRVVEAAKEWIDEAWDVETLSNNPDPPTSASNETSIVQLGHFEGRSILLTSDVGPQGFNEAADYAQSSGLLSPPYFVQVPHHGSRRNVTPSVLDRWLGPRKSKGAVVGRAFCSVGNGKKDYPRGQTQNAFERRGYPVYVTRQGAVRDHQNGPERAGWVTLSPEPFVTRIQI